MFVEKVFFCKLNETMNKRINHINQINCLTQVRELVPESQAYMDLLAFERKLDSTIMRKRLDIQEALKRPMKQKRKLRIFISNTSFPAAKETQPGPDGTPQDDGTGNSSGGATTAWELRVEGRLIDEEKKVDPSKSKRKFSSFFKSLVIELDKDLYGPDNHLVEWRRTATTQETDGFQVCYDHLNKKFCILRSQCCCISPFQVFFL